MTRSCGCPRIDLYESRPFAKISWISLEDFGCGKILYCSRKSLQRRTDSATPVRIGATRKPLIMRAFVLSGLDLVALLFAISLEAASQKLVELEIVGGGVGLELPLEGRRDPEIERRQIGFFLRGGLGLCSACRRLDGGFG